MLTIRMSIPQEVYEKASLLASQCGMTLSDYIGGDLMPIPLMEEWSEQLNIKGYQGFKDIDFTLN